MLNSFFSISWRDTRSISEKAITFIVISSLFAIGLYLRWMNIDGYSPQVDEFTHLQVAFAYLRGDLISYHRAFWTVSVPIIAVFKLFGVELAFARMTVSFINLLGIFPLYFFMKRFGRLEAFIAVALFIFSPMVVAVGQLVRDFAVLPVFIYITYFFALKVIESDITDQLRGWIKNNLFNFICLSLLTAFAIYDQKSTVAVIVVTILVFLPVILLKILFQYGGKLSRFIYLTGLSLMVVLVLVMTIPKINKTLFADIYFTPQYFEMLTNGAYQNWSYFFPQIGWLFLVYAIYLVVSRITSVKRNQSISEIFISLTFFALMTYVSLFLFSGVMEPRIRYYVVFIYYLIPIAALFFTRSIKFLKTKVRVERRLAQVLIVPIIFIFLVNIPGLKIVGQFSGGYNKVSGTNHFEYEASYNYIKKNIHDGDAIITDQLNKYDLLYDNVFLDHGVLHTNIFNSSDERVGEIIATYDRGWVVKSKNSGLTPKGFSDLEDTVIDGIRFQFIDQMGDNALWYFEK